LFPLAACSTPYWPQLEIANEKELELNLANSTQNAREQDYVFAEAIPPQNVVNLMQKRQPELVKTKGCDRVRRAVWMGRHKLIETEGSAAELYDVLEDPTEALDLSAILPENVEVLQDCLQAFANSLLSLRGPFSPNTTSTKSVPWGRVIA
jgi:hypothetical protein